MKSRVKAQAEQTGQTPAAQATSIPQAPGIAMFVDNRPGTVARRQLQETCNNSLQVTQQRAFSDSVNNSPRIVAQRKLHAAMSGGTVQEMGNESPLQGKFVGSNALQLKQTPAPKSNHTGLPDTLKAGVESLSGISMDHVKVHYNSSQPAQLNAHAYAQGSEIHVAPGQEQHLPHEAWHVVQQAQGRVRPTMQMKGTEVNDDVGLETEADRMGAKALGQGAAQLAKNENVEISELTPSLLTPSLGRGQIQRILINGEKMSFPKIAEVINGLEISRGVKQNFIKTMDKLGTDFTSAEKAAEYILTEAHKLPAPIDNEAIKKKGDATEDAAAAIIGGKVNRGAGNRDVEWRLIGRDMLDGIKDLMGYERGHATDNHTFVNWKSVLKNESVTKAFPGIHKIISTPVDAFSNDALALAGGASKFVDGTLFLQETAAARVAQLLELSQLLGYTPVLVFSETVTCLQCEAVASKYGIDVTHLGERQHTE